MTNAAAEKIVQTLKEVLKPESKIQLSAPSLSHHDLIHVKECIDTGWVSSVGKFVTLFEEKLCEFTGAKYAIVTVNGTAALHIAYMISGIKENDEVLTQSLTFVGTINPIHYLKAIPHFVDVDTKTLGIDVEKLDLYLKNNSIQKNNECYNVKTGRRIKAIVVMHTFGNPSDIKNLKTLAEKYNLVLIEDTAEALGSEINGKHLGTDGACGILSFNGNKIVTTGGGGAIITNNEAIAKKAKHLTTTAKVAHAYEFNHDEVGFNYRMPNLNAALGVSQLARMKEFLAAKKSLFQDYKASFKNVKEVSLFESPIGKSNNWLIALILQEDSLKLRNEVIELAIKNNIETRPVWNLQHKLAFNKNSPSMDLSNSEKLERTIINIPSSSSLRLQSEKSETL